MVQLNLMPNCPITTQDIKNAKTIFGKDIGALKGTTMQKKPKPVVTDYIHVPPVIYQNNHEVTLCMDIFFIKPSAVPDKYLKEPTFCDSAAIGKSEY
eukprot:11944260-Ditylum_brightwellii.AAC.1